MCCVLVIQMVLEEVVEDVVPKTDQRDVKGWASVGHGNVAVRSTLSLVWVDPDVLGFR